MPFKKPTTNNKTRKQQQQKKAVVKPSEDAASVEEIIVTDATNPCGTDRPLEEVQTDTIISEEELAAIAAHEEYMWVNYYGPEYEENMKRWQNAQIAMLEDPEYWDNRRSNLLLHRQRFHKKAAWSPEVFHEVDEIDKEIQECEDMIDRLEGFQKEAPSGNPILGGIDWWKEDHQGNDGWVSSR